MSIPDPRHIQTGRPIPSEGYADQPYVVLERSGVRAVIVNNQAVDDDVRMALLLDLAESCEHQPTSSGMLIGALLCWPEPAWPNSRCSAQTWPSARSVTWM